jgi:Tol biopolymer transport system component
VTLTQGIQLGVFRIHSPLGKGGMGEVYRATDTRLNRDVAIKVLPEEVAGNAERLARFEREARLLAALNHPNIAQVFGFEGAAQSDGSSIHFLAMELVPGQDLAERLLHGPIPIDETINLARQVAGALEQAHETGIVHRDLKPANIKVTPDGTVKVLDFGLAKADSEEHAGPVDLSHSPTFAQTRTQAGVILGTAAYMSPEQVRGKPVDRRTDIWAFGAVLYEMLAGQRLFAGDTVSDLLAAVLREDPKWAALPSGTPPTLAALLRRCLERDPKRRLRDIGEARIALDDIAAGVTDVAVHAAAAASGPSRRQTWFWLLALAATALAAVAVGRFVLVPSASPPRSVRFEISAGDVATAVVSPDGTKLVIAAQGQLWLRDLSNLETRALEQTDGAVRPFWSPDGHTIAYGARGKLWKVVAAGGVPTVICDLVAGLWDDDAGGAWLSDGTIVYSNGNAGLWRVSAQGGDPAVVVTPDGKHQLHFHTAAVLPDGHSVMYVSHFDGDGRTALFVWSDGQSRQLLELAGQVLDDPVYSPTGHILFHRTPTNAGVWALPFSMKTLQPTGEPFLVSQGMRSPSAAMDGTLVMLPPRRQRPVNLVWADREGKVLSRIDEPRLRQTTARISPEGDRVVVAELEGGKGDIWQYDLLRHARIRLTRDSNGVDPSWTPDGGSVLYDARSTGRVATVIKRVTADGSGRTEDVGDGRRPAVVRDGSLLFGMPEKDGWRIWYRPLADRNAKPIPFVEQSFYNASLSPSPDGRFVAYEAEPGPDQSQIYLRRFPPTEGVWQVTATGGTSPRWSRDGRLFFAHGAEIFEVQITATPDVRIGTPTRLFTRTPTGGAAVPSAFDVSPDGKRFLIYEPVGDVNDSKITVALNWFAELPR